MLPIVEPVVSANIIPYAAFGIRTLEPEQHGIQYRLALHLIPIYFRFAGVARALISFVFDRIRNAEDHCLDADEDREEG